MAVSDIGLVARARGVSTHLVTRQTLESLAEAADLESFTHALARLGDALEPVRDPRDVFAAERAIRDTALRHLATLRRWQERIPGVLDVFFAFEDRRSLRALVRGAAEGTPTDTRLAGLLPTPTLPARALVRLARQSSPSEVVRHLVAVRHPDAQRLLPLVRTRRPDLLAVDVALMRGCAERATLVGAHDDDVVRAFVSSAIDVANAQNALLLAADHRDVEPADFFVRGGQWVSSSAFVAAASATSTEAALTLLAAGAARSPLAPWFPSVTGDADHLDRAFLVGTLAQLTRAVRLNPLGSAPVLRTALLVEAQSRDLRTLAWGAVLGTPAPLRTQHLLTPA